MLFLDTSAAIELLRGSSVPEHLKGQTVGISTVVEMELHLGALHGGGRNERQRVNAFLRECTIFPFDRDAALETAKVLAELWQVGTPIGDFDSQIAGHARFLQVRLLTTNARHFKRVNGLHVIKWEL